ncbi:hypothetical protein [Ornithobacterium rhinotracheale]|uniref:hypothetical protein n=1 Tax=Ornithobacterium rhinotracheale TaxID=28251 RepID=UPI001FF2EE4D|nr:hypothetical protein [Ornithobacterium rhinotracheale]MCK0199521.1 hypothetical protein [Ornithobacterium rhinotracheale]
MQEDPNKKPLSMVERMKLKAKQQQKYGGEFVEKKAEVAAQDCPNCGAGRAKHEGVTHCAYCGFQFIEKKMDKGIFINDEDNSHPFKS